MWSIYLRVYNIIQQLLPVDVATCTTSTHACTIRTFFRCIIILYNNYYYNNQRTQFGRTLEDFGGQPGRRQPALWKIILNHDTSLQGKKFSGFCLAPGYICGVCWRNPEDSLREGDLLCGHFSCGLSHVCSTCGQCGKRWPIYHLDYHPEACLMCVAL